MQNDLAAPKTAAMLAIGDELLSGRTQDKNIAFLAETLSASGLELREVRIVPDKEAAIIAALNALRAAYDFVFTSGGIGPTHDDITAESVARAFGKACIFDPRAEAALSAYYHRQNSAMTEGRRLMTRMPEDAELIDNHVSGAPGFRIGNCFIMAGVPQVFQAMLQNILPCLPKTAASRSMNIACPFGESLIAAPLGAIARAFPQVSIGSYPQMQEDKARRWRVELILRSRDPQALQQAAAKVKKMLADLERSS